MTWRSDAIQVMNAFTSPCSDAGGFSCPLRKVYVDFCTIIWYCDTFFISLHRVRIVSNAEERLMNVNTDAQANGEDTDNSSSSLFFIYHNGEVMDVLLYILSIVSVITENSSV